MATQAVSYLRVSSKGQIEGDGFKRQRLAVAKYAKANRIKLVAEFRDEGVSGRKELADREGLAHCLDRVANNCVSIVLVERSDRLARDVVVSEIIISKFRDLDVRVIAADAGTDLTAGTDEPTPKLIRHILAAFAEFDRDVVTLRLKVARDRVRRATGRCEGQKPFGSKAGEQDTLDLMKRLRRKPRGGDRPTFAKIADELNKLGRPCRAAKKWTRQSTRLVMKHAGLIDRE